MVEDGNVKVSETQSHYLSTEAFRNLEMADDELAQVRCFLPRSGLVPNNHRFEQRVWPSSNSNRVVVEGQATQAETMRNREGKQPLSTYYRSRRLTTGRKQETEARSSILTQILEPEAADRLGRIRMVKESRATDVENRLIMLARSGQLRAKVTEDQLKDMLASLSEHEKQSGQTMESVKVVRRGGWDDDDDLDDLLNES
ncbi:hypothetical protein LTR92_002600 [Exophiala xenobiotica]|nr:hypothetical protein LTR92_002600 [Exophiala xenobiotica]